MGVRRSEIVRDTKETSIRLMLDLDDNKVEDNKIDTGSGFMDHMLTLMAAHGNFRLDASCKGDTYVDYHHSVEDVGIALGEAFKEALGNKAGITRYGSIILPMDETLIMAAIDISGRAYLNFDVPFYSEKIGELDTELIKEFFIAFTRKAEVTLHFNEIYGENNHHIAEGCFKAFGRILAQAVSIDSKDPSKIPSTKGILD